MQGRIVSPTLFNIIADNVICMWLDLMVEDQRVALGRVVENVDICLGFYADNGMVGSIDSDWLQHLMNASIGLFWCYGLVANVVNYRKMTSQPCVIRSKMSEEARERRCTRVGSPYREKLRQQIPCSECGVKITTGSMTSHRC